MENLPDSIVIAGPNGCGKSSVLDAIRLLKSAYGQYRENEYHSWFNEFQIDAKELSLDVHRVLHDPTRDLLIEASIELCASEKLFLGENGATLAKALAWNRVLPKGSGPPFGRPVVAPTDQRIHGDAVERAAVQMMQSLALELDKPTLIAALKMTPAGDVTVQPSPTLELVFSTYNPAYIGVIDYHGANRNYSREKVGSVNLNVTEVANRSRQSALYDTQSKYTNVKAEMASAYVRELLAEKAGVVQAAGSTVIETLKELFDVFFPGKCFVGPEPTSQGSLLFRIKLENGASHDLDELSSGEKEVLLGYLRLRNSAPNNSVILLDEPELHLNPRLIRGLPRFYQKHIGDALGNQLWMITHSDTLLREAMQEPGFALFHMRPAVTDRVENQARPLLASEQVEIAIIDLVGDLASYSPDARIVMLEGGGDSNVDLNVIRQLFPDFSEKVTLVSAGGKSKVRELHSFLEQAAEQGTLKASFYSIVDRDFDVGNEVAVANRFAWDVYHIENYLLRPRYIRAVMEDLEMSISVPAEADIAEELRSSAEATIGTLLRARMERQVNHDLVSCIRTSVNPKSEALANEFRQVAETSLRRLEVVLQGALALNILEKKEDEIRQSLNLALSDGSWIREFRGRDVLKQFISRRRIDISYPRFRNLIVSRMKHDRYKPRGMQDVIDRIAPPVEGLLSRAPASET